VKEKGKRREEKELSGEGRKEGKGRKGKLSIPTS